MSLSSRIQAESRQKNRKIKVGMTVRSLYQSKWTGVVIEKYVLRNDCFMAKVKVTHDKNGAQLRKPTIHDLNVFWLELIA